SACCTDRTRSVAVRTGKSTMSSYLRVPLASAPSSVRAARDVVRTWLVEVGRSGSEHVAAQIITERTTNAVVHARGPLVLHLGCLHEGVRIGGSGGSTVVPRVLAEDPAAAGGRGLQVVAGLATQWATDVHDRGKIVWAEVTEPTSSAWPARA